MKEQRNILEINEELCNGCGLCILDCAEHALAIVDGKAKIISDALCDGLGACIQGCPQNALTIVTREALPYDESTVEALQKAHGTFQEDSPANKEHLLASKNFTNKINHRCPSTRLTSKMQTSQWPIKLRITPANSFFLQHAHVLMAADCAPAVYKDFHTKFDNKVILLCCPKFETHDTIVKKLSEVLTENELQSLDVLRMEVPCCLGLQNITDALLKRVHENGHAQNLHAKHHVCSREGELIRAEDFC